MTEDDAKEIFAPTLKVLNVQHLIKETKCGGQDSEYFWFNLPHHHLELQQELKVTIYCSFDFSTFPFDSHYCDLILGVTKTSSKFLYLRHPWIISDLKVAKNVKKQIHAEQSRLPFDVKLESQDTFDVVITGHPYAYAGMRIYLKRNSLGLLIGGFYGPTAIFTLLTLLSFTIESTLI